MIPQNPTILSLFNGMGCIWIALDRLGITPAKRYVSEVDKFANQANDHNYPGTIHLGDVREVRGSDIGHIDLLVGGSPCQGFSMAGKGLNFDDPRSKLFFEFVRIKDELQKINPNMMFLLENVPMKKQHEHIISRYMGCNPIKINATLVSAQNRERLFWTNINTQPTGDLFGGKAPHIPQPKDRHIYLRDILEEEVDKKYLVSEKALKRMFGEKPKIDSLKAYAITPNSCTASGGRKRQTTLIQVFDTKGKLKRNQVKAEALTIGCLNDRGKLRHVDKSTCLDANQYKGIDNHAQRTFIYQNKPIQINPKKKEDGKQHYQQDRVFSQNGKCPTLLADLGIGAPIIYQQNNLVGVPYGTFRRLTPVECCRLQGVPDNYFYDKNGKQIVSDTQIYKMTGNGWNVDVIAHILSQATNNPWT